MLVLIFCNPSVHCHCHNDDDPVEACATVTLFLIFFQVLRDAVDRCLAINASTPGVCLVRTDLPP